MRATARGWAHGLAVGDGRCSTTASARYEDAFAAAAEATADPHELWFSTFASVELIEAASRSGRKRARRRGPRGAERIDAARAARRGHSASKPARGRSWLAGTQPRRSTARRSTASSRRAFGWTSRALICSTASGCDANADGSTHANSCGSPTSSSPTSGWRRSPSAHGSSCEATGEHARKRTVDTLDQLTPQEAQISRLAAQGQHEPRDRRAAVHQPEHRRVPPAQGVPEARREVAHAARAPDLVGPSLQPGCERLWCGSRLDRAMRHRRASREAVAAWLWRARGLFASERNETPCP